MANDPDTYEDIRDAVAKLCAQFPGEYWRTLDREMAYPTEFRCGIDASRLVGGPHSRRIWRRGTAFVSGGGDP